MVYVALSVNLAVGMPLTAPLLSLVPHPVLTADRWFAALDGRTIQVGEDSWCAQVLGIHEDRGELWIQIAPHDSNRGLVIHCWHAQPVDEVLRALREANRNGAGTEPQIIAALHFA